MEYENARLRVLLFAAAQYIKLAAVRNPSFKQRLKEKNITVQIKLLDNSIGRSFIFKNGKITSKSGIHPQPDVCMGISDARLAGKMLSPARDQMEQMNAMKNFCLTLDGPDELTTWFMEILSLSFTAGMKYGLDLGNGVKRYVNNSNAGPMFVDVKDGKIIRMTPLEFDDSDAPSFTIQARGKNFTPPRKCTLSPFGYSLKSTVYSKDRILYPLKRVDFNPRANVILPIEESRVMRESVGMKLWIWLLMKSNGLKENTAREPF